MKSWRILNVDGYQERMAAYRAKLYQKWMLEFFMKQLSPRDHTQIINVGIPENNP